MNVLILGATGFVGSYLMERAIAAGHAVLGTHYHATIDNRDWAPYQDRLLRCDIRYREQVDEAIRRARPDVVYLLAAQSYPALSWQAPVETLDTNVVGTANAVADPDLIAAFVRAHRELERGDGSRASEELVEACGTLFARWGCGDKPLPRTGSGDRASVDRALATIHARSRDGVTLDTLADAAGVSPFQLIRLFRRFTGMPPHAHLVRARLHDALRRIRRGAVLAEAALAAGFFDQPAMTRAFRRAYGITPGQYRDAVRAGR